MRLCTAIGDKREQKAVRYLCTHGDGLPRSAYMVSVMMYHNLMRRKLDARDAVRKNLWALVSISTREGTLQQLI